MAELINTGISPSSTVDELLASECTSCEISQDHSAYWSPNLMFFDQDTNKYEVVPEVAGHITYYKYVPAFISNGSYVNPIAIPNGMKMISGSNYRRNFTLQVPDPSLPWSGKDATQDALRQKAVGFNCLNYDKTPEGTLERHFLPNKTFMEENCPDGIRLEVLFPICWNGKDLHSQDFTSHVAYSDAGANGGRCPEGFDVVINQLLFETIYPTQNFIGKNGYYLFSNGDPTGHGYHGDAFIAWEGTVQEDATAQCGSPTEGDGTSGVPSDCPVFDIQSPATQSACTIQTAAPGVNMNLAQAMTGLPGGVIPQFGPEQAVPPEKDGGSSPTQAAAPNVVVPSAVPSVVPPAPPSPPSPQSTSSTSSAATSTSSPPLPTVSPPSALEANQPGLATLRTVWSTVPGTVYEEIDMVETVTVVARATVETPGAKKREVGHMKAHLRSHGHRHHG